jgi:hypothetical protein
MKEKVKQNKIGLKVNLIKINNFLDKGLNFID